MTKALLAGSFDPPTLGHCSLISRAAKLFSKLYICIAVNESKKPLFPIAQRLSWLKVLTKDFGNIEIFSFSGLTVEAAKNKGVDVLVRGARHGCDFEYEAAMAQANLKLTNIETMILPATPETAHIIPRAVRFCEKSAGLDVK